MLDHIILAVRDLERSVTFYEMALAPLGISHYVDYDGQNGHPDLKGFGSNNEAYFWLKSGNASPDAVHFAFVAESPELVDAFLRSGYGPQGRGITFHRGRDSNIIPAIMPPMCSTRMGTVLKSYIKA